MLYKPPMTRKTLLVALLVLSALGVWAWRLSGQRGFDARQFQQVEGIQAVVAATRPLPEGYLLMANVTNQSSKMAQQVVLTARLRDAEGNTLVENPLVQISELAPQEERSIAVKFITPVHASRASGELSVTLVRWDK